MAAQVVEIKPQPISQWKKIKLDFKRNKVIYLMLIPIIAFYIIFSYAPMWGILVAFQDYKPAKGMLESSWVGLKWFKSFISGPYFIRTIRNTFMLNLWGLVLGFPAPIILALMLNEVKNSKFKRVVQTITYMPHFISLVVLCGIIHVFCSSYGPITELATKLTGDATPVLGRSNWFRPIYTISGIWQEVGWGSIIYLSAMSSISPELYESAQIDGAGRFRQIWSITIPSIMPTITILFIFAVGGMMNSGFEKIILLYNPLIYDKADVIGSYVYRIGLKDFNYSLSTAVGLMNSVISFIFLWATNALARKYSEISIW